MSATTVLRPLSTPKKALAAAGVAATAAGMLLAATPAQAARDGSPARPRAIAKQMIGDPSQYQCFAKIVDRESGWSVHATNASSGAYGLLQALPGSKMASAGPDWKTNPATQIKWGLRYMKNRYGSPCGAWSFWRANGWY